MTKTACAKVEARSAQSPDAPEATAPVIKPANVTVDHAGQVSRSIVVRAPETMVADDLRDPKVWRLVQGSPYSALIKMDRVMVIAYDESWIVEGLVRFASNTEARLLILKVSSFGGIGDGNLFSDGNLEVYWTGADYGFRRMNDKVSMGRGFGSEGAAIDALRRWYPKKVG